MAISNKDSRENLIGFYKKQLGEFLSSKKTDVVSIQQVFYLVHKLEFYNELSPELKVWSM